MFRPVHMFNLLCKGLFALLLGWATLSSQAQMAQAMQEAQAAAQAGQVA